MIQNSELSDTQAVSDQLREAICAAARVGRQSQRHPYGSTVAIETSYHVELATGAVAIPVETDVCRSGSASAC